MLTTLEKINQALHYYREEQEEEGKTVIEKKWGQEVIFSRIPYGCKIMILKGEGSTCSLHCHKEKSETFILLEGKMKVLIVTKEGEPRSFKLTTPFSSVTIPPMCFHSFTSLQEETVFIESSSEDQDKDSYRVTQSTGPN